MLYRWDDLCVFVIIIKNECLPEIEMSLPSNKKANKALLVCPFFKSKYFEHTLGLCIVQVYVSNSIPKEDIEFNLKYINFKKKLTSSKYWVLVVNYPLEIENLDFS